MVPRLSTWTLTPISNMSAEGAIAMSACWAWASIRRTASEVPDSTHDWLTDPSPADPVTDDRQRQVEVGRRLDEPYAPPHVEVGHRGFEVGLAGAVDQVEPERPPRRPEGPVEPLDRPLDGLRREPRGAEDAE